MAESDDRRGFQIREGSFTKGGQNPDVVSPRPATPPPGQGPPPSVKDDVAALLSRLPDDCSFEDVQYHLSVLAKVRNGIAHADRGDTVEDADVDAVLSRWIAG